MMIMILLSTLIMVLLASPENSCFLCDTSSIFRHTTTVNSFQLLFPFFNIFFSGIEHNQCCNIQHSANANILENDLLFHQPCCFFFFPPWDLCVSCCSGQMVMTFFFFQFFCVPCCSGQTKW